jgi:pseudaminic acid synthase
VTTPRKIVVGSHTIGDGHPPFVIAEMSGNHNQSLERALAIVDAVARAGAHALKLQTYTAETMTLDIDHGQFRIEEPGSLWKGQSLYRLYQTAHTPWEWHEPIFARCRAQGMVAFSSPFDATAVDFLERLDVPCYKIASFENTDHALLRKVATTGKPVIVSTGMATAGEVEEAVRVVRDEGNGDIVLLKCTSSYPAPAADTHLMTIPHMRELFGCPVGLSDHTLGIGVAVASVAVGATVIEKHFTLSRSEGGVDAMFSLEESELRMLVEESRRAWEAIGEVHYGPTPAEKDSRRFRRSLYVVRDIARGERFGPENVRAIRPGFGLTPRYLDLVLGRRAARDVTRGTPLTWDLLD